MRLPRVLHALLIVITISAGPVFASTTHHVRQDGSGDFTTIGAAVAVAVAGDVIEVGPGIYPEMVDVYVTLTFISTGGAAATIMDGESTHYPLWFRGGIGHVVDGFTFRNGYHASGGGAIRCMGGATLTLRNSIIEDNHSEYDGGGLFTRDPGAFIHAIDCTFRGNHAVRNAGAGIAILGSRIDYTRCTFVANTCGSLAGGVTCDRSYMDVTDCLFVDNVSAEACAAVYYHLGSGVTSGSTFYSNTSASHGSVLVQSSPGAEVTRNIIAFDESGAGLAYWSIAEPSDPGPHACNVIFGNAGGMILGDAVSPTDVALDPVFCGAVAGDYTISIHSPAAPANSPCGELIGAFSTNCDLLPPPPPPPPPPIAPVIIGITDVADDQGRQVRIRWDRIRYDAPGEDYTITGYAIYRRQNDAAPAPTPFAAARGERAPMLDGWDYIATVPARGDDIYQYVAPTLCDTPKNGDPCWSFFFVSAMTPNPLTYFDSAPDSGYSEDNLPPAPPNSFAVAFTGSGAHLTWKAPADPDIASYRVYRTTAGTTERTLIHTTDDTEWVDSDPAEGTHYLLAAVDDAGNEGAAVAPTTTTGAGPRIPTEYFLGQNAPNPFNPSTSIEFGVPAGGGRATIEIFDVAGRRVRTILDESRGAGTWRVTWDGTTDEGVRVSSGVYFYRLRSPGFEETRRMTLVE